MGIVRAFETRDIPQVAELYATSLSAHASPDLRKIASYLEGIFFNLPWRVEGVESLVYEENDGQIAGFIGILPRNMTANGSPIVVAVTFHFMVKASSRLRLAGIELCHKAFQGPQDLTLTDGAGDLGRKVWEGLGGCTALLQSMYWTRPLRPSHYTMTLLSKGNSNSALKQISRPFCTVADMAFAKLVPDQLKVRPQGPGQELDVETYLECLPSFTKNKFIRPNYERAELEWLFQKAAARKELGQFQKVLVRNNKQATIGWYIFHLLPGGISTVLQIGATKETIKEVLDHLFYRCWEAGSLAVTGRMDPQFVQELSQKFCLFDKRGPWVLIHSRRPEILNAIHQGNVFLTRLEGELCVRMDGDDGR